MLSGTISFIAAVAMVAMVAMVVSASVAGPVVAALSVCQTSVAVVSVAASYISAARSPTIVPVVISIPVAPSVTVAVVSPTRW